MKFLALYLVVLLLTLCASAPGQRHLHIHPPEKRLLSLFLRATATFAQEAKRVPKGIREADKAEEFEKSIS